MDELTREPWGSRTLREGREAQTRRLGEALRRPGMPPDKRVLTVAVGAIAALERHLAPWWGDDIPDGVLTDDQRECRAAFRRCRTEILDLAHRHMRQLEDQ